MARRCRQGEFNELEDGGRVAILEEIFENDTQEFGRDRCAFDEPLNDRFMDSFHTINHHQSTSGQDLCSTSLGNSGVGLCSQPPKPNDVSQLNHSQFFINSTNEYLNVPPPVHNQSFLKNVEPGQIIGDAEAEIEDNKHMDMSYGNQEDVFNDTEESEFTLYDVTYNLEENIESATDYESDTADEDQNMEEMLFDGSHLTSRDFSYLFLIYTTKHCLSDKAKKGLLEFFDIVLPDGNNIPSLHMLEKSIDPVTTKAKHFNLCASCHSELISNKCHNEVCDKKSDTALPLKQRLCYYVMDVESYLQKIVAENYDIILRYKNTKSTLYEDFIDGEIYANKTKRNAVTLVWHIDGAPTLKSRNLQIWLITSFLVELGLHRYSLQNIIPGGLWYGPNKPDFDLFQISFTRQIRKLMMDGFRTKINGQEMHFNLNIQAQLADLPAKAASLKMKQFNGKYGCTICYHPGEAIGRNMTGWVYPYRENVQERKFEDVWKHAHEADATGNEKFGVKGKSVVLDIQKVPEETPLDYMHLVLEGEWKRKLQLLLDPKNGYITEEDLNSLNNVIKRIKYPHDFKEKVAEVTLDSLRKAKAMEQQLLLLHIIYPLLKSVLNEESFIHLGLLVTAIQILNYDKCSNRQIDDCQKMLKCYHKLNEEIYDRRQLTYTNHALVHLAKQRQMHGCPLVLASNFVFEGFIATLKRQYHGSRGVVSQMVRNISTLQDIERHCKELSDETIRNHVKRMLHGKTPISEDLRDGSKLIGKVKQPSFEIDLPERLSNWLNGEGKVLWSRLEFNGRMYHSLQYKRRGLSASYMASFHCARGKIFGEILAFASFREVGYSIVKLFKVTRNALVDKRRIYTDDDLRDIISRDIFGSGFTRLEVTNNVMLLPNVAIRKRFIYIPMTCMYGYATDELLSYQHD